MDNIRDNLHSSNLQHNLLLRALLGIRRELLYSKLRVSKIVHGHTITSYPVYLMVVPRNVAVLASRVVLSEAQTSIEPKVEKH